MKTLYFVSGERYILDRKRRKFAILNMSMYFAHYGRSQDKYGIFVRLFACSCIRFFVPYTLTFVRSFSQFVRPHNRTFVLSFGRSLVCCFVHSMDCSFVCLYACTRGHTDIHSFAICRFIVIFRLNRRDNIAV